jgi:hypothetical protein
MHEQMGAQWASIAQELPGRNRNDVRNRFMSIRRMQERGVYDR